ncbi:MAG: response regulator [Chloroflexi bacterium]|nr:response regulator [Chloroflexota bacterium]
MQTTDAVPTLFVVDDDVATLQLLRDIASDSGWSTQGFTSLSQLLASLETSTPTLLILDDDLPDGRGGDLARELRRDGRLADVPTVVCTAAHPMRRAEIGAWAPVIAKPFELGEIDVFLRAAARGHRAADSDAQHAG